MSKSKEIYLIDGITNEIVLVKKFNTNKVNGFLKTKNLNVKQGDLMKFITFDIESITDLDNLQKSGDVTYFDPIFISAFEFKKKRTFELLLRDPKLEISKIPVKSLNNGDDNLRKERMKKIQEFFSQFIQPKYNKYVIYAHNLSSFDGIFILESLLQAVIDSENPNCNIKPIIKDNKIISIRIQHGWDDKRGNFRYYLDLHDSLLLMLNSLDKLSKSFLKDNPEIQKLENKKLIDGLLYEDLRKHFDFNDFIEKVRVYCIRDSMALAYILKEFALMIHKDYGLNIHKYPTAASLALAIYQTKYLKSNIDIPLITGKIYRDISKAYHGGFTEVYKLYSDKDVHSYDFVSMYPSQMVNKEMPCGNITSFEGNPLSTGTTLETLRDQRAFVKCSVYVDKSLNRPVYLTNVIINGEMRSICGTGVYHNQWVYVPELMKYEELTLGKIRILRDTIQKGYLFDKAILFKDYVESLFALKQTLAKTDPKYLIVKILLNSLYGRMGLRQELTGYTIKDRLELEKFTMSNELQIKDVINLFNSDKSLVITFKDSEHVKLKSSVAIAAAITAEARMTMAPIILDESLDILYIDTDSYKCTEKITENPKYKHLDHNGLGGLQYEGTFSESIYLLPKVYGGIYKESSTEFAKVKGFKDKVEFDTLKDLLFKNQEIKLTQNKWFRDMLKSEIKIMKSPYLLSLNENKRKIDLKNLTTKPYHFDSYDPETKD